MTDVPLSRKVALTGGADFWHLNAVEEAGIEELMVTDGPHGVRKQAGASDHVGLADSVGRTPRPRAASNAGTTMRAAIHGTPRRGRR